MLAKTSLYLLSAMVALCINTAAGADTSVNVKSETVRYDDLRLISAVGASVLYARLRSASERVCGGPTQSPSLSEQKRFKTCVDEALTKSVADVNHPVLNQYATIRRSAITAPGKPADSVITGVSVTAKAQ